MNIAIVVDDTIEQIGDLRTIFSNVSFPTSGPSDLWLQDNNAKVITYWKPHDHNTQKLVSAEPYIEDGEVYAVEVEPYTEVELAAIADTRWTKIRAARDKLLAASDWIVVKSLEASSPVPADWVEYRQTLRDITTQEDPLNVVWPELPSE